MGTGTGIWRGGVAGLAVSALLLCGACGLDVDLGSGTVSVDGDIVTDLVEQQVEEALGEAPDVVDCPELSVGVGTELDCEAIVGDQSYGVTVTVTGITDGEPNLDVRVDDQPAG